MVKRWASNANVIIWNIEKFTFRAEHNARQTHTHLHYLLQGSSASLHLLLSAEILWFSENSEVAALQSILRNHISSATEAALIPRRFTVAIGQIAALITERFTS